MVLIDIQGAFHSLWGPDILRNLNRTGVSKTMFGVVTSYFSNRTVTLQNDGEFVNRLMLKGFPQGSVLGPLLWNITFDSLINKEFPIGVRPIAYTDVVTFVIEGDTRRQMERIGNDTMHVLQDWATETKMTISSHESKLVILKGNMNAQPPVIKYMDIGIGKVDAASYLGVEIDTGLTFLPHAKKQGAKARTLFGNSEHSLI